MRPTTRSARPRASDSRGESAHCEGGIPYHCWDVPPRLVLVGTHESIPCHEFLDDSYGTCSGACYSYYDFGDLNGDGRPDCPVHVIPTDSQAELDAYLAAAYHWNHGQGVNTVPSVQLLGSDEHNGHGPIMPDRQCALDVAASLGGQGYPTAILLESQAPLSYVQRGQMGAAAINAGIRYLWAQGRGTDSAHWTDFVPAVPGFPGVAIDERRCTPR